MIKQMLKPFVMLGCKLIPLHKEVLFISFNGHYSDSPMVISEKLHELRPDIRVTWLVDSNLINRVPRYVRAINIESLLATYKLMTAKVIVDNVYCKKGFEIRNNPLKNMAFKLLVRLYRRKNQVLLSTWHGTPIKKMGLDQVESTVKGFEVPSMVMLHGNRHVMDVMNRITFNKIQMDLIGTPRNEILFSKTVRKNILKQELGLPLNKKVILFAPTFRSDGNGLDKRNILRSGLNQINEIDFEELFHTLTERFGDEWIFVGRFHYFVEKDIDWNGLSNRYGEKIINGNECDDMSRYLVCTDVLITDCSSCMFDFALTGKPTFLYFPDVEYYRDKERGFYFNIEKLPFSLAKNYRELIDNIRTFDEFQYEKSVSQLLSDIGNNEREDASERIINKYIIPAIK